MLRRPQDTNKNDGIFVAGLMIGIPIGMTCMALISAISHSEFKKKSIESGAAYYDTKTGEFTWKEQVK